MKRIDSYTVELENFEEYTEKSDSLFGVNSSPDKSRYDHSKPYVYSLNSKVTGRKHWLGTLVDYKILSSGQKSFDIDLVNAKLDLIIQMLSARTAEQFNVMSLFNKEATNEV